MESMKIKISTSSEISHIFVISLLLAYCSLHRIYKLCRLLKAKKNRGQLTYFLSTTFRTCIPKFQLDLGETLIIVYSTFNIQHYSTFQVLKK